MPHTPSGPRRASRNAFLHAQLEGLGPSSRRSTAPILRALAAAFLVVFLSPLVAFAGPSDPPSPAPRTAPSAFRIARTTSPIHVDGKPDETAWQSALLVEIPYEVMPGENIPAPVPTECRLAYDDDNLYALFRCTDPRPEEIRARLSDRDGGWGDDRVGIMLDTFNDERRAFEFMVNPLGTQADIFRNDVGSDESEDETWDTIWSSAGQITSEGYVVEIAIPFASLRFPRTGEEHTWGFSLFRDYWRENRHQLSSTFYDRNRNCQVCQYGKLTGLRGIAPGRNLEFDPTYTENHEGTPTDRYATVYANISGPRELYLRPSFEHNIERFAGTDYTTSFGFLRFGARPSGPFNVWGVVGYGEGVDYENENVARRHWGGPGFSYNYGRHVKFYIDHTYEYMSRQEERVYNANLIQSRLVYQFTSRAFARCVVQLTDIDFNPCAYRPELQPDVPRGSTRLLLQVLGSYKVNAQTVVYVGYSDGEQGRHPLTVRSVDRTLFAKLGYAWLV